MIKFFNYAQISVTRVLVTGPTSFAPIIEMATTIVEESGGQYHVLLIIADGQVINSLCFDLVLISLYQQSTLVYWTVDKKCS